MGLLDHFYTGKRKRPHIQSIVDNLNHMLNTRKGFGSWLTDYGIGDYNAFKARKKSMETLIEEIKESIRKYEPRVQVDDIKEVESSNAFRVRLEVHCTFLDYEKPVYILIDSVYNRVTVEGF